MHFVLGIIEGGSTVNYEYAQYSTIVILLLGILVIFGLAALIVLLKNMPTKKQTDNQYSLLNNMMRATFVEFGEKIDKSLKETIDTFGSKLTGMAMEVSLSSQALDDTVNKFDQCIKDLAENMSKITEFNGNLGANIEKMNESFERIAENLNSNTNIIETNFDSMGNLSKNIKESADEMISYNKQIVQDMASIVSEVKGSVMSIKDLGEVLQTHMSLRSEEAKEYQENINQLIEKVSGDISILGYNTATAFSKTIEETTKSTSEKVLQDIISVAEEIKGAAVSIKEFSSVLKNDLSMRNDEAKEYHQNVSRLMDKVNEEITLLGEKTASAFSLSLEQSAKSTTEQIEEDLSKMAAEIETSVSGIKELNEVLKGDLDTRIHEAREYHENITKLMLKISSEMSLLGENTTEAFSKSLEGNGQAISEKITESIEGVFKGFLSLLDEFKENEKLLAKTIVMLPDQVITYNETAANKIGMQLDEVKRLFRNGL